jgi:hypothetical protein
VRKDMVEVGGQWVHFRKTAEGEVRNV